MGFKNGLKSGKCVFLFKEQELEKVIKFRPPLFFNFRGGHSSSTFSNSCSFLRYAFLGLKFIFQNIDFWEKSSYYSSFYMKKLSFDPDLAHFWNSSTTPNATYLGFKENSAGPPAIWAKIAVLMPRLQITLNHLAIYTNKLLIRK